MRITLIMGLFNLACLCMCAEFMFVLTVSAVCVCEHTCSNF